jgi:hypothetical protein
VALFFCAAGLWFTGVVQEVPWLTALAIAALAMAMVLEILGRGRQPGEPAEDVDALVDAAEGAHLSSGIPDR